MARDPKAEVEISAHSRNLGAKLREARSKFGKWGAELKKEVLGDSLFSKAGAHALGNIGSSAFGKVGGFLQDQAQGVYDFQRQLTRLQITAEKSPEEMQAFAEEVRKASDATGLSRNEILSAGSAYVALTGDLDTAKASIGDWAAVAQATGSTVSDVSSAVASLSQNMKVKPGEVLDTLGAIAKLGKIGAVEMKDLAGQVSNIAPSWANFAGGTGPQGVREMVASLEIAKRGFGGDASQTVTGLNDMLVSFRKHSDRLRAAGVNVFNVDAKGTKTMKNVLEIVDAISKSSLMKDPHKLQKALGLDTSVRAFEQLAKNRDELGQFVAQAQGGAAMIGRDLNTYLTSPAGRIERAFTLVKNKIADAITPERIEAFANAIERAADIAQQKLLPFLEKVGGVLGSIEGVGESVRGALSDVEGSQYSMRDVSLANSGGFDPTLGADNSDQAQAARLAGAKSRLADVDAFNAARNSIMGAEVNERTSPASIQAAFAAKYNSRDYGKGHLGGEDAGRRYLEAAKVQDPFEVAMKATQKITDAGNAAKASRFESQMLNVLQDILHEQRKGAQVNIDGNKLVSAYQRASVHAGRPR